MIIVATSSWGSVHTLCVSWSIHMLERRWPQFKRSELTRFLGR
jgi:hypothetical protein